MIEVSAAIVRGEDGRILICRRGAGGNCPYLWEFPGGKREPGESRAACAVRECAEELGVRIEVGAVYAETTWSYPDKDIAFTFFDARIVSGTPALRVHSGLCWVKPEELGDFTFCPADVELVCRLAAGNL